jgi:hypothetical protein
MGRAHERSASLLLTFAFAFRTFHCGVLLTLCLTWPTATDIDRLRKRTISDHSAKPTCAGARSVGAGAMSKSKAVPKSVILRWLSGVSRMCAECDRTDDSDDPPR